MFQAHDFRRTDYRLTSRGSSEGTRPYRKPTAAEPAATCERSCRIECPSPDGSQTRTRRRNGAAPGENTRTGRGARWCLRHRARWPPGCERSWRRRSDWPRRADTDPPAAGAIGRGCHGDRRRRGGEVVRCDGYFQSPQRESRTGRSMEVAVHAVVRRHLHLRCGSALALRPQRCRWRWFCGAE
jgi:hypothetical protein